jgi:hypothetical protein
VLDEELPPLLITRQLLQVVEQQIMASERDYFGEHAPGGESFRSPSMTRTEQRYSRPRHDAAQFDFGLENHRSNGTDIVSSGNDVLSAAIAAVVTTT